MKSSFFIALALGLASLLIAFVPVLRHMFSPPDPAAQQAPSSAAPWQVALPAPGESRVFGLQLPGTTLADARRRWPEELKLALMTEQDGAIALEGYVERFEAGGVAGRLLLAFDTAPQAAAVSRWRDNLRGTPIESGGRQHALSADASTELGPSRLAGLSFIPTAQLDAALLTARFGPPAERIAGGGERLEHWLYPALGLAVVLDSKGRDVLQYVAPADFERRLAAPLRAAPKPP
jgi:hypothetical protein